MQIFIRVDASIEIGTGHVMRCLTYAQQQKKKGNNVVFICREAQGDCINLIKQNGFRVFPLPQVKGSLWDFTKKNWYIDVKQTIQVLHQFTKIQKVVVDHYSIDEKWEKVIRPYTEEIMVIDDLADRKHDCDVLLDQNFYLNMESRYEKLLPNNTKLLLGPKYALLRDEFIQARKLIKPFNGKVERLFIFFGGSDPTNETEKVLQAIKSLIILYKLEVDVVVGNSNPNKEVIRELCETIPGVNYHCQINYIAELMAEADLAIGAGGATTWERAYLQLPSIVIAVAENQIEVAEALYKKEIIYYLGTWKEVTSTIISQSLLKFLQNTNIILKLRTNSLFLYE